MSEEYDYYQVDVVKKSGTQVYIKVPKGRKVTFRDRELVRKATVETVENYDWDDYGWERDLEIEGIAEVDKRDAIQYDVYDASNEE